jgi:hypothetical protein
MYSLMMEICIFINQYEYHQKTLTQPRAIGICFLTITFFLTIALYYVHASYGIHPDVWSPTGSVLMLGRGGILCKSSKQKIVTKSSTEAELVGASDMVGDSIHIKHFLENVIKDSCYTKTIYQHSLLLAQRKNWRRWFDGRVPPNKWYDR